MTQELVHEVGNANVRAPTAVGAATERAVVVVVESAEKETQTNLTMAMIVCLIEQGHRRKEAILRSLSRMTALVRT